MKFEDVRSHETDMGWQKAKEALEQILDLTKENPQTFQDEIKRAKERLVPVNNEWAGKNEKP